MDSGSYSGEDGRDSVAGAVGRMDPVTNQIFLIQSHRLWNRSKPLRAIYRRKCGEDLMESQDQETGVWKMQLVL